MEKIPTTDELIAGFENSEIGKAFQSALISFAKIHVEAALKAASEQAVVKDYLKGDPMWGQVITCVDKQSILAAYPPELIK